MRLSPGLVASALVAFALGYVVSRTWRTSEAQIISGILQPSFVVSKVISSASSAETPTERLISLCEQRGTLARDHSLFEALQGMNGQDFILAVMDFPALVQRFEKLPPDMRHVMTQAALERWLEVDAEGAKRWLGGAHSLMKLLPEGHGRELDPSVMHALVPALARNDADWCRNQLDKVESKADRENALRVFLREVAKADPQKARAMFAGITDAKEREQVIGELAIGLAESDPQSLGEVLRGITDPGTRSQALAMAMYTSGKRGPTAMRDLLALVDDPKMRTGMIRNAMISLADQSSADLFAFFEEQLVTVPEEERGTLTGDIGILRPLSTYDASRAAQMIASLDGKAREQGIQNMLGIWAGMDATAAMKWLGSLPAESLPVTARDWDNTLTRLANGAPAEFGQWVDSLPAGELQDRSRVLLAMRSIEQGQIAQAVQLFQKSATGSMSGNTAQTFGRTLAGQDPLAAADCVAQLPPGRTQAKAAEGVAAVWSAQNPSAAAAWVAKLPEGTARDAATGALANSLVYADPATASEWIEQIRDPAVRTHSAMAVFRIWAWEDPIKARAWLRGMTNVQTDRIDAMLNF